MRARAAILLSGGMDSIALAFWKRPEFAITVDYGQAPAHAEIQASREVARALQLQHEVLRVDCSALGSGDLAGSPALPLAPASEWWPFRNQLIATIAGARALTLGSTDLLFGTVSTDAVHADGTAAFIESISGLMSMQEGGLRVSAPAVDLTSTDLIKLSGVPLSLLAWAHSCHTANFACGQCRGCAKHRSITHEIGLEPY